MTHGRFGFKIPQRGAHRRFGECGERQGRDEARAVFRQHRDDASAGAAQFANELERFIGSNAAADDEENGLAVHMLSLAGDAGAGNSEATAVTGVAWSGADCNKCGAYLLPGESGLACDK